MKGEKRKALFNVFSNDNVIGLRFGFARSPFARFIPFNNKRSKGISGVGRKPNSMFCNRMDER